MSIRSGSAHRVPKCSCRSPRLHPGDEIVVRSGNMIPLDGTVIEGEAMVNQAALTGESMPVRKTIGATVYAGTVVEEGECVLTTKAEGGANRYDKIVAMIEESEKLKSSTENRALALADRLVPGASVLPSSLRLTGTPPAHLLPDGRFLLRPQALHAAGRSSAMRECAQAISPSRAASTSRPCPSRHHRLRQDRHPDPRYPQGGQGRPLLRLQRERGFAAGRLP